MVSHGLVDVGGWRTEPRWVGGWWGGVGVRSGSGGGVGDEGRGSFMLLDQVHAGGSKFMMGGK